MSNEYNDWLNDKALELAWDKGWNNLSSEDFKTKYHQLVERQRDAEKAFEPYQELLDNFEKADEELEMFRRYNKCWKKENLD
jgi:hypothetical protein